MNKIINSIAAILLGGGIGLAIPLALTGVYVIAGLVTGSDPEIKLRPVTYFIIGCTAAGTIGAIAGVLSRRDPVGSALAGAIAVAALWVISLFIAAVTWLPGGSNLMLPGLIALAIITTPLWTIGGITGFAAAKFLRSRRDG